jgi:hypothetical protein
VQTRTVECPEKDKNSNDLCDTNNKPSLQRRCNRGSCDSLYAWKTGPWSKARNLIFQNLGLLIAVFPCHVSAILSSRVNIFFIFYHSVQQRVDREQWGEQWNVLVVKTSTVQREDVKDLSSLTIQDNVHCQNVSPLSLFLRFAVLLCSESYYQGGPKPRLYSWLCCIKVRNEITRIYARLFTSGEPRSCGDIQTQLGKQEDAEFNITLNNKKVQVLYPRPLSTFGSVKCMHNIMEFHSRPIVAITFLLNANT